MEYVTDAIKVLMDLVFDYVGELEHSEDLSDYPKDKLVKDFILYHAVDKLFQNLDVIKGVLEKHGDDFWKDEDRGNMRIVDELVELLAQEGYELQLIKK